MSDVFIFCGTFSDGKSDKDQMNTSCQYKLKKFSYFRNLLRFDEISILENNCISIYRYPTLNLRSKYNIAKIVY